MAVILTSVLLMGGCNVGETWHFNDVPQDSNTGQAIENLWQRGWVAGVSEEPPLFEPNRAMSRAEISVLLVQAEEGPKFTPPMRSGLPSDVDINAWYASWVGYSLWGGLQDLMPDGLFHPDDAATRSDVASLVHLLLSR